MPTSRRLRSRRGFTLIEVLMAMVLLGIGLMMTAPLAIVAIRTVGLADRDSRAAATATLYLEDALVQLRGGFIPQPCADKLLPNGDRVTRSQVQTVEIMDRWVSRVEVTVVPEPRGQTERPFTIASNVFHSSDEPTGAGRACP